jgi:hypothetical protein
VQRIVSELIAFIGAESKSADFHFGKPKNEIGREQNGKKTFEIRVDRAPSRLIGARRTATYFMFHLLHKGGTLSLAVLAGH